MAYSDSFPAVRPVFQSDFANGGRIDPRISYSRSTTGTYFGTDKHLSSENLIKHSEGSAVWGGTATITYGYTNGPDGVTGTALRLESASGTERYRYSTGGQFVSGTAYTVSCWVKSNTGVAQTFRFMCSTTANQSTDLTTHATDWTRVTATITPNTTNIFAGFVFLSANTNDISVWGLQVNTGSDELDYQATTTQIHREYAPTLQTAASGAARFEHSATDGQSEGILIEGQSTNLVTYSETLATGWTEGRSTLTAASGVAPDGTLTSNLFTVDGTAANSHNAYFEYASGGATPQTFSIFAKKGSANYIALRYGPTHGTFSDGYVFFDLSNGTKGTVTAAITESSIVNYGNGWYRCSITNTALQSGTARAIIYVAKEDNTLSFDGNSYDHIQVWGAQIEANQSFASSYIKSNSGSTTTRAADSLSITDSSLFDTGSGAIICELGPVDGKVYPTAFALTDSSTQNIVRCQGNNGATQMSLVVNADNSGVATITQSFASAGTKLAVSYDTNSFKFCTDGGTVDSDTAGQVPEGLNRLEVGGDTYTSSSLNGNVKRIAVYPSLSDANLQAITS